MNGTVVLAIGMMVVCLAIQCMIVAALLRGLVYLDQRGALKPTRYSAFLVLGGVMVVLMMGNIVQMALWAGMFVAFGEFGEFSQAFYHSVVNFTTLGYGDVVMSEEARLVGALEAANGVLMIGLSTAFLFAVLDRIVRRALAELKG